MNLQKISPAFDHVRKSLPPKLHQVLDQLVEDYKFSSSINYGKEFVSYKILADLVKAGWRRTAKPIDEKT